MHDVREFGAKGDGVTKDTEAIQRAIDAGGVVYFSPGTYLTGTIYLKSGGGLHLDPGAVILASPDREDYNRDDFCPQNHVFAEAVSGAHLIVALEQRNITITGTGAIDGNRGAFYPAYQEHAVVYSTPIPWRPGQMLYFCECEDVSLDGVRLLNAPYWTCFLHGCENVIIRGLHIYNWKHTRNGDGIDLDCCRFVTVSDCVIDVGDDAITLRGHDRVLKKKRSCEFITVTNCILKSTCNAIRVGVGNGTVRAAVFSDLVIHGTRSGITLCSKYSPEMGVLIEDIQFRNLYMEADNPLRILINSGRGAGPALQPIRRISFAQVRCRGRFGVVICGEKPGDIGDLEFCDWRIVCSELSGVRPNRVTENSPSPAAFYLENVSGAVFRHISLCGNDLPEDVQVIWVVGCDGIVREDCGVRRDPFVSGEGASGGGRPDAK